MKFGDKYELLESLTTGAVETFVANDKVRGERVVVHILDCAVQKPNQSTAEWVLESFRRVAPEPPGPVLETGKYSGSQYAYLVTKLTDEAALRNWIRLYEIQGLDTQETSTPRAKRAEKPLEAVTPPVVPARPSDSARPPVSVTQLIRDFDSQKPPAQPLPSLSVGRDHSGLHAASPWEPVRPPVSAPPKNADPAGFPSSSSTSIGSNAPKPGEFTSFFQGPFRGDGPSDMPAVSSRPIEVPQKRVGEFTAVFGSAGTGSEQTPPALEESGANPSPTGFTGLFKDMETPARTFTSSTPVPPPGVVTQQPGEPFPAPPKPQAAFPSPVSVAPPPPVLPPTPAVLPISPSPNVASDKLPIAKPSALAADGATGAFLRPVAGEPAPIVPQAPVGPSPYTQVIARDKLMASTAEEGVDQGGSASAPPAVQFAAPPMPKVTPPQIPQVKMPPPPAPPKFAAPAPPKAPKLPKVEAPAPPPISYWPLIITLTVLFFLGVLLVMYFLLKGH